jgi:hypothetical protein
MSSAYLAYLDGFLERESRLKLYLVDRSKAQLELASEILNRVSSMLKHVRVECEYHRADLVCWHNGADADLVLLGHVLTENARDVSTIMSQMVSRVLDDGRVYTIERTHDPIWNTISGYVEHSFLSVTWGRIRDGHENSTAVSSHIPASDAATRFLVQRVPEKKSVAAVLKLYFTAWQEKSIDLLDSVFCEHATYQDKPNNEPLRGLAQIREYWRNKVLPQRNIVLNIKRCSYTADQAWSEWEASFLRDGKVFDLKGILVLSIDQDSGRVRALHEYYSCRKSQCND